MSRYVTESSLRVASIMFLFPSDFVLFDFSVLSSYLKKYLQISRLFQRLIFWQKLKEEQFFPSTGSHVLKGFESSQSAAGYLISDWPNFGGNSWECPIQNEAVYLFSFTKLKIHI